MNNNSIKSYKSTASTSSANNILAWLQKEKSDSKQDLFSQNIKEYVTNNEILILQKKVQNQKEIIKDLTLKSSQKPRDGMIFQLKNCQTLLKKAQEENEKLVDNMERLQKMFKKKESEFKDKLDDQRELFCKDSKIKLKIWQKNEQTNRERILQERTEKIKRQTMKMMEPDIEKIVQQNRIEVFKLKERHREDINNAISELQKEHLFDAKRLQNEIISVKDKTRQEEQTRFDSRLQKLVEEAEWENQKQKLRLENDFNEKLKKCENDINLSKFSVVKSLECEISVQRKEHESRLVDLRIEYEKSKHDQVHKLKKEMLEAQKEEIVKLKFNHSCELKSIDSTFISKLEEAKSLELQTIHSQFEMKLSEQVDLKTKHLMSIVDEKITIIDDLRKSYEINTINLKCSANENNALLSKCNQLTKSYLQANMEIADLHAKLSSRSDTKSLADLKHQVLLLNEAVQSKDAHSLHLSDQLQILQRKHDAEHTLIQDEHLATLDILKSEFQLVIDSKNLQLAKFEKK
eukprot:NODE_17_length_41373_cov_0.337016.p5 type:complete len:519 gc:universal NODE_17_length_41373_cov_0.337016:3918-2362(-)